MRPLIIDEMTKDKCAALVRYAEKDIVTMDDLLDTVNKQRLPIGDDPGHVIIISVGYRCVFSIEDQPAGKVRHLSISIDAPGKLPSVPACEEIIKLFGFDGELYDCKLGFEDIAPGHQAINILEIIKP
jgi:hypothetical protein